MQVSQPDVRYFFTHGANFPSSTTTVTPGVVWGPSEADPADPVSRTPCGWQAQYVRATTAHPSVRFSTPDPRNRTSNRSVDFRQVFRAGVKPAECPPEVNGTERDCKKKAARVLPERIADGIPAGTVADPRTVSFFVQDSRRHHR